MQLVEAMKKTKENICKSPKPSIKGTWVQCVPDKTYSYNPYDLNSHTPEPDKWFLKCLGAHVPATVSVLEYGFCVWSSIVPVPKEKEKVSCSTNSSDKVYCCIETNEGEVCGTDLEIDNMIEAVIEEDEYL